ASFLWPRLQRLLERPNAALYKEKISEVYGPGAWPLKGAGHVEELITLKDHELFKDYLRILYLSKLVLVDRKAHAEAAFHMAQDMWENYNVGKIRLKFTLSRSTTLSHEQVPGADNVSEKDVVLGLYEGLTSFKSSHP